MVEEQQQQQHQQQQPQEQKLSRVGPVLERWVSPSQQTNSLQLWSLWLHSFWSEHDTWMSLSTTAAAFSLSPALSLTSYISPPTLLSAEHTHYRGRACLIGRNRCDSSQPQQQWSGSSLILRIHCNDKYAKNGMTNVVAKTYQSALVSEWRHWLTNHKRDSYHEVFWWEDY